MPHKWLLPVKEQTATHCQVWKLVSVIELNVSTYDVDFRVSSHKGLLHENRFPVISCSAVKRIIWLHEIENKTLRMSSFCTVAS